MRYLIFLIFLVAGCEGTIGGLSDQEKLAIEQDRCRVIMSLIMAKPMEYFGESVEDGYSGPLRSSVPQEAEPVAMEEPIAGQPIEPTPEPERREIKLYEDFQSAYAKSVSKGRHFLVMFTNDPSRKWVDDVCSNAECRELLSGWVVCVMDAEKHGVPYERSIVVDPVGEETHPIECDQEPEKLIKTILEVLE